MTVSTGVQCYRVGGSVRDELMGLPAGDRDWVVVGATPEQMIARGFQPVGKDFPVFLHPKTHEEYALARTERKTAPGYKGFAVHFAPDVSLEDDLLRRDITINAMAVPDDRALGSTTLSDAAAASRQATGTSPPSASAAPEPRPPLSTIPDFRPGPVSARINVSVVAPLIDPFNGLQDLRDRIFRHVSPAFREDPVRILRIARFAARFPDFRVADETMALMREMSAAGEVDALVPERVWQEISRGLMSARPSRMMQVLDDSGALAILLPPLSPVVGRTAWLQALDDSAARHDPLPVRFSIMMAAAPDSSTSDGRGLAATERCCVDQPPGPGPAPGTQASTGPTTPALPGPAAARVEQLARGLRAPNDCIDAAQRLAGEISGPLPAAARQWLQAPARSEPAGLLALLARHDAWRRPERLQHLLRAIQRLALEGDTGAGPASIARIEGALAASQTVDTGQIARQHAADPSAIRAAIDAARLQAIEQVIAARR